MNNWKVVKQLPSEFWLEVNGRTYRIPEGLKKSGEVQSFTKHSQERRATNRYGHDAGKRKGVRNLCYAISLCF